MNQRAIDEILREAVGERGVPGVVATVATDQGVVYEGGFGERKLGGGVAMTPDTVIFLASMTKAITGAAAMQQVERGKIALDAPAADVVPEIARAQVIEGFDGEGKPKLRPPKRPITLRHLLTHTAGFGYEMWSADIARYEKVTGTPPILACARACLTTPLLFDPGESWEYGIGIDWAGRMVEEASGLRIGAYLQENLFAPLGMWSTSFKITPEQRARLATVHARLADGALRPIAFEVEQDPEMELGGAGLYGTVGDYLRFERMILNGGTLDGSRVLEAKTVATMAQNQMGEVDVRPLRTVDPALSNDADFWPGMKQKWGLSFLINTEATPEGRSPGSLAWAGLINAYYWIDPAKRRAGILATQILPFFDGRAGELFRRFEKAVDEELR